MKNGRIEVKSVGPDDGAALGIHANSFEKLGILQVLEDRTLGLSSYELELSDKAIIERNAQNVRSRNLDLVDVRDPITLFHGNGSIVPTAWPAWARPQAPNSSSG